MNVFGIPYDLMKALVSVAHFCRSGHGGLRPSDASVRYRVTDESVQSGSYLQGGHAAEVLKRVNGLRLEVIETPVSLLLLEPLRTTSTAEHISRRRCRGSSACARAPTCACGRLDCGARGRSNTLSARSRTFAACSTTRTTPPQGRCGLAP